MYVTSLSREPTLLQNQRPNDAKGSDSREERGEGTEGITPLASHRNIEFATPGYEGSNLNIRRTVEAPNKD